MTFADDLCAFSVTICAYRADCIAMFTLLFIEDDEAIRTALRLVLEDEGYEVAEAGDGETGIKMFGQIDPDLVLLDLRLPDISGFEVCRAIRRTSITPVIMVTAQTDTSDLVNGFDAGADDYVTKPVVPKELAARIRAAIRRTQTVEPSPTSAKSLSTIGDVEIDRNLSIVRKAGVEIPLTKTEYRLLVEFADHPGMVMSRDQLLELTQGRAADAFDRSIDLLISRLRVRLGEPARSLGLIKTVRSEGYVLATEVLTE
jgi:DNA-binding response OmpR family regulator